ncbi:MAG: hypothetical protein E6J62_00820 [Deltaproteobacteria bacterium]|nr:MAG: hypothetical protein E6J62_00820 [Deltaproteobacteria bacterium]
MIAGTHWTCERPSVDGSGNLAVWMTEFLDWPSNDIVFLDAAGTVKGNVKEYPVFQTTQLTGQISGFEGLVYPVGQGVSTVVFAADGNLQSSAPDTPPSSGTSPKLAEDPTGGVMAAFGATLDAYDASGARRFRVQLAHDAAALGVDRAGNALVLSNPGSLHGQWVDHSGKVGPDFDLGVAAASFELYPRIGSGLFLLEVSSAGGLFQHTAWVYQLDSLAAAATPAPDWLASRPDRRLHMAHGGTAYAMLPIPAPGDCTKDIEVLAPSGKSCGSAKFQAPGSCANFIDVGYDGTVVQQLPAGIDAPSCTPGEPCRSCTWRWWPGFFR